MVVFLGGLGSLQGQGTQVTTTMLKQCTYTIKGVRKFRLFPFCFDIIITPCSRSDHKSIGTVDCPEKYCV